MNGVNKKVIKYGLIGGIGTVFSLYCAVFAGVFFKNSVIFYTLFFLSLFSILLLQWWATKQDYGRGFDDGKRFAGDVDNEIEEVFNNREREMRLRIQKDLKKHGIDVVLIKEEKKYDA